MGFLNNLGQTVGEYRASVYKPYQQQQMEMQAQLSQKEAERKQAYLRQMAEEAIDLVNQRSQATNPQIPLRPQTWTDADRVGLSYSLKQAGLDPSVLSAGTKSRAEADIAQQKSDLFRQGSSRITSPYAQAALGLGKDVKPVTESGGAFFRQYEPENFMTGQVTPQSQAQINKYGAETATENVKTEGEQFRLENFRRLFDQLGTDPLLGIDALQNKTLSDTKPLEYKGLDGKTHKAMAVRTPTGYVATPVTLGGQPVEVPGSDSKSSLMQNAEAMVANNAVDSVGDALTILTSGKIVTPNEKWGVMFEDNKRDDANTERSLYEQIDYTLGQWGVRMNGAPLPANLKASLTTAKLNDKEHEDLKEKISRYEEFSAGIKNRRNAPPPPSPETQLIAKLKSIQNAPPPQTDTVKLPEIPFPKPSPLAGTGGVAQPAPMQELAPLQEPKPTIAPPVEPQQPPVKITRRKPTSQVMNGALTAIDGGANPLDVRNTLIQNGYDMSPNTVIQDAIKAINAGVPRQAISQRLIKLGYDPAALMQQQGGQ